MFLTLAFTILILFPLAIAVENHYLYVGIANILVNPISSWLEGLNIYGLVNQALGLVLSGLIFSFIGITGFIIKDYIFKDRKYIAGIFAFITIILFYWGVSTFYLFKTVESSFFINDYLINYNGALAAYICRFFLPLLCLWSPLHLIFMLNIYTHSDYSYNRLNKFGKLAFIKGIYWSWIKQLIIPWICVALAIIHTNILIV